MTDSLDRDPTPRSARSVASARRRRHAAAASRLFVGGFALAGTLDLVTVMASGAEADQAAAPVAPPVTSAPTTPATVPAPPVTIVVVRRHVIVDAPAGSRQVTTRRSAPALTSSGGGSSPAPAPAPSPPPAPAPPPAPPVTTTKGS